MKRFCIAAVVVLTSSLVSSAQGPAGSTSVGKQSSIGFGLGIPYGVLGTNLDANVAPNLNISVGLGTTVLAGMGYNFGAKYFLTGAARTFRPRVSAYYGVNSMIAVQSMGGSIVNAKSFTGLSVGFGGQWLWGLNKNKGLDLDIIYIATTSMNLDNYRRRGVEVSEPGRIKIAIGFRRAF